MPSIKVPLPLPNRMNGVPWNNQSDDDDRYAYLPHEDWEAKEAPSKIGPMKSNAKLKPNMYGPR